MGHNSLEEGKEIKEICSRWGRESGWVGEFI
jgi:hypothetical protein